MNQCPINILTVFWPPFVIEPEKSHGTIKNGIEINIIATVASQANFNPNYITMEMPENWGTLDVGNQTGTGMMGELLKKKGDIAIGNISPNPERHQMFDFTVQYMQVYVFNF